MKAQQITINGTDYMMRSGIKAIIIFEEITKEAFEIKRDKDVLVYIYSCILAATDECKLGFDEMMDAFDDDPTLFARACDIAMGRKMTDKIVELSKDGGTEPKKE